MWTLTTKCCDFICQSMCESSLLTNRELVPLLKRISISKIISIFFVCRNLAPHLQRCHYGDTGCIAKIISTYVRTFKSGLRELNLASLDPLHVNEVDIIQGNESPVNINLNFKDVDFYGLSDLNVKKVV